MVFIIKQRFLRWLVLCGVYFIATIVLFVYVFFPGTKTGIIHRTFQLFGSDIRLTTRDSLCTHGLFRKHYKQMDYLPSGGHWIAIDKDNDDWSYQSDVCIVKSHQSRSAFMRQCFGEGKIKSIVTIGDSNAQRYWLSLWRSVRSFSGECHIVKSERLIENGTVPDLEYYTQGNQREVLKEILVKNYRYCRGCSASKGKCIWRLESSTRNSSTSGNSYRAKSAATSLEHLPLTLVLSTSLRLLVKPKMIRNENTSSWIYKYFSPSSVDFYFNFYLADSYPDILLIFLPFNHVKFMNPRRVQIDIEYFHALVKLLIPRSTRVFYMPSFTEFEEGRKKEFWTGKRVDGLLAWQRVDKLNRILYGVIKDDLRNASSDIYSFFDLFSMSTGREDWNTDGVHMKPVWYDTVVRSFWDVYCNSVFNKDF